MVSAGWRVLECSCGWQRKPLTALSAASAGEYRRVGGQRFEGVFERGLAAAGREGTWTDSTGARYRVTPRRATAVWDLRDDEAVFASRERLQASG